MWNRVSKWLRAEAPVSEVEKARLALEARYPGVVFGTDVQIIGLDHIQIGVGSCIGDRTWLNDCQRNKPGRLEIGRYVLVGRGAVITTGNALKVGDFTVLGPDVYIADTDHVFADPLQPILQQGITPGNGVTVEENCWLGIQSKIFGELTVGRGSVVAAGSIVRESVPPFAVVAGVPARIVKLYDFSTKEWRKVRDKQEVEAALLERQANPPPTREEYTEILHRSYTLGPLDGLLAGANRSI